MNVLGPSLLVKDKTNAVPQTPGEGEGVSGAYQNELDLELSDNDLLKLAEQWEIDYNHYAGGIVKRQETNKKYYLGRQNQSQNALDSAPVSDNILFEATETFLAQALARNPDPVVYSDNTDFGTIQARSVRTMLTFLADALVLRQKMKMMVRHWNVYFIGILKHGWDSHIHEITTEVRNPKNFILDPNGYVDPYGDFIGFIGEKITATAQTLVDMFPKHEDFVSSMVDGKMGTQVTWTEWWTDEYTFTTFKKKVLDKSLNPHFNYPQNMPEMKGDRVIEVLKEGNNHFARPKKPYTFLSVFSLQEQPHDETSLIEQNRRNQDIISERSEQLAKSLRRNNNSWIFNLQKGYTQQTAKQALDAFDDGHGALEPNENAVRRVEMANIPDSFFKEQEGRIENLRSVYGTLGNTPVAQDENTTARGMILNQQRASDRIGGTIGDALNQVASNTFNWWVQLMHVYYDQEHTAAVMGKLQAVEEASITAEGFTKRLIVTAAPDSTQPKDSITEANQTLALFKAGLPVDPKTVLQLMDVPDIEKTIEGGLLFKMNPQQYVQANFPELAQDLQQAAMAQQPTAMPPPGQPGPNVAAPTPPQEPVAPPANPSLSQVHLPS